jgi:hypothetical protein
MTNVFRYLVKVTGEFFKKYYNSSRGCGNSRLGLVDQHQSARNLIKPKQKYFFILNFNRKSFNPVTLSFDAQNAIKQECTTSMDSKQEEQLKCKKGEDAKLTTAQTVVSGANLYIKL